MEIQNQLNLVIEFLFKLGKQPKGIIGSGYATTEPFIEEHWNDNKKSALYIDIDFEILLNPNKKKNFKPRNFTKLK